MDQDEVMEQHQAQCLRWDPEVQLHTHWMLSCVHREMLPESHRTAERP